MSNSWPSNRHDRRFRFRVAGESPHHDLPGPAQGTEDLGNGSPVNGSITHDLLSDASTSTWRISPIESGVVSGSPIDAAPPAEPPVDVPAESVESAGPVESVEDEPDLDEIEATGMAEIEAAPAPERRAAAGPPPDDIAELVAAAVEGNRRATNELLAYIEPRIRRYCRGRIGRYERSHASADDVAQEVLFAVLKALPKYKERGRPFLAFVYGIAHNKVADAHRMSHRNRSDPYEEVPDSADVGGGPEALALAGELQGRLGKMLDKLQKNQRDILLYRVVVGLSAEETAETVGSTAGAVRVAQHRALQKLRQMLAAEVDL